MFLAPDTELGAFRIVRLLGSGGMGEVYLAHDRQLNRSVAIKVLHDGAMEPRHLARFEQEARAASTLSHPNVAHIYQLGATPDGRRFLAMEYVEGEPLDQRVLQPLPPDEALDIAIQIASALTAAHAAGVVHRDIKPANVIVRRDGLVKVLDFGLAKRSHTPPAFARREPTQSIPVTEPGTLLGTPDYMSPEQVRGQDVDARTDIWALGVVLYEMLTGRRPFEGPTRADVQAAVLQSEPSPLTEDDPVVALELLRILRKTLRKDPALRYQGMQELLLDLEAMRDPSAAGAGAGPAVARPSGAGWRVAAPWAVAAILGVGVVLLIGRGPSETSEPVAASPRLSVEIGADGTLATTDAPFALSADGTLLAFAARTAGKAPLLYVRRLDQLTAMPLNGTEGASTPCWSPDAQWLAFFADAKLKKVRVTGGAVVTLADAPEPRGAWWAEDGTIVFAPHFRRGLQRVSSLGGPAQPLTALVGGEISHRFPQVLPGGQALLYTASTEVYIGLGASLVVQHLSSGERRVVHPGGYFGRYLASGHLAYVQDDTLFVLPFDRRRLAITGPAWRAIGGVASNAARGSAQAAFSETGTMAYLHGRNDFDARPMAWMDRAGKLAPLRAEPEIWTNPEFSPDGRRIAMDIRRDGHSDVWTYDWTRDAMTRVTSESTNEEFPVWTPDGTRIAYHSLRSSADPAGSTIAWKRADGSGPAQVLVRSRTALRPGSWHPTRKLLAYVATQPGTDDDVLILPIEGNEASGWRFGRPTPFVNTAARERLPRFSPDGKWLSYSSNEAGLEQVYVQPFPGPGERVMVSNNGVNASWSQTRPEIVFSLRVLDYRHALMVARYRVENGAFRSDVPRPWSEPAVTLGELSGYRMYALTPDGLRVAIVPPSAADATASRHVTLVLNLFDELRRNTPRQ